MSDLRIVIDSARLTAELERLAGFSDAPAPAVTRILYTPTDMQARAYLIGLFEDADLRVRYDAVGNIFARWQGEDADAAPIGTGSHTDAIPYSGRYDGTVGVLGALEAFRALKRAGFHPRRSLELLLFTAEEPTRFGLGCLGSRALSGARSPESLLVLRDGESHDFDTVRQEAGYTQPLASVALPNGYYAAFVELHIEQGPRLEAENKQIGIVTAIAAPATLRVHLEGEGGHAGVVLMPQRRDALVAGAEIALAVEAAALSSGSPDTVATVGVFQPHPGAVNSIPSRVLMEIDIRDIELERREATVAKIRHAIEAIGQRRRITTQVETLNADPPATCDPTIVQAIQAACEQTGHSALPMISRAYHDSLFMARIVPTGMIFLPSHRGISHRPDEYSSPEQIAQGVEILALTLARLAE